MWRIRLGDPWAQWEVLNNRDSSVLGCKIIMLGILYKGVQFLIIEASLL